MPYQYPHTIENGLGEKIIILGLEPSRDGDKLIAESFCQPGAGPAMHTHFQQDEVFTVLSGKMGHQILGEEPKIAHPGDTVFFKRGTPHKFWVEGQEVLHCSGWVQPAHSTEFFLGAVFAAQNKSGKAEPERFDGAYLLTRYASEYDMLDIPWFVRKIILPIVYVVGMLLGKYKHFEGAPEPLK